MSIGITTADQIMHNECQYHSKVFIFKLYLHHRDHIRHTKFNSMIYKGKISAKKENCKSADRRKNITVKSGNNRIR
jgi:hypothetical protein